MNDHVRFLGPLERALFLRSLPGALPPKEVLPFALYSRERVFRRGERLTQEGRRPDEVFFIVEGRVAVSKADAHLAELRAPHTVGLLATLAQDVHGVTLTALEDTTTLALAADVTLDIYVDHFNVLHAGLRQLAGQTLDTRLARPLSETTALPPPGDGAASSPAGVNLTRRLQLLRTHGPFHTASIEGLAELVNQLVEVGYAEGEVLWSEGDAADYGLFVVEGWLASESEGGVYYAGPGDSVGTLSAIAERRRTYTVRVVRPIVALRMDIETLLDVLEDNVSMGMEVLGFLAARLTALYQAQHGAKAIEGLNAEAFSVDADG